jgi:hypothetical protein
LQRERARSLAEARLDAALIGLATTDRQAAVGDQAGLDRPEGLVEREVRLPELVGRRLAGVGRSRFEERAREPLVLVARFQQESVRSTKLLVPRLADLGVCEARV